MLLIDDRKVTILFSMMQQIYLLNDGSFRLPYIDLHTLDEFASLDNNLFSLVELLHEHGFGIAPQVSIDLLLYVLRKLQVLIDLAIHLHACLI